MDDVAKLKIKWELTVTKNITDARIDDTVANLDLHCQIDVFRIGQVFRNLFENSIAACDDASVQIRCHNGDGTINVALRDNGTGLNAEQQANLFQPFFTTKSEGTGLGMVIVKRIIEAHGGEIRVGDCTNGAEFLISLPLDRDCW